MLRAALMFFVLGIISLMLGLTGVAGLSFEAGRTLMFVFIVLSVLSFIFGAIRGRRLSVGPNVDPRV